MTDREDPQSAQSAMDELVTVTLPRRDWLVIVGAASDFDARVPREQGDGGECLDVIRAALDQKQSDGTIWDGSRWITDPDRIGRVDYSGEEHDAKGQ
jgi:hypothetical protein